MMFKEEEKIRTMKAENLIVSKRVFNRERKGGKKRPRKKDNTPKKKKQIVELRGKPIPKLDLGKKRI